MLTSIAGNWKMHGMAPQLREIEAVAASVKAMPPSADILTCLPATLIARAVQMAAGSIAIGGEGCSTETAGAFTGDLRAEALKGAGASARSLSDIRNAVSITARPIQSFAAKARAACCAPRGASDDHLIAGSVLEGKISSGTAIGYEPLGGSSR